MNSNLFSHPDVQESVAHNERCAEPAEYPTFSDRPDTKAEAATPST